MMSRRSPFGWELPLSAAICAVVALSFVLSSETLTAVGLFLAAMATPVVLLALAVRVLAAFVATVSRSAPVTRHRRPAATR